MAINVKSRDVNVENKILNLMFKSEDVIDIVLEYDIQSKDFTDSLNQNIFNEIVDIYRDYNLGNVSVGEETNLIFDRLQTGDRTEDKELLLQLNKIKTVKAVEKHINIYLDKLTDFSKLRNILDATRQVSNYLKEHAENVDIKELVNIYDNSYQNVYVNAISDIKSETTSDATKNTLREIIEDSMAETKIKFNLDGLDDYSRILDGYLTYIVGDTGVGKTTVGTYLASACALNGIKILYVNLETKNSDCIRKLISANVKLNDGRIKYSHLINSELMNEKEWDILEDIAINDRLAEFGIYWLHDTSLSVESLEREIVRHVRMYDIDMVIGDYYQLLIKEGYEDVPESVVIPKVSKDLMRISGKKYVNPEGRRKLLSQIGRAFV